MSGGPPPTARPGSAGGPGLLEVEQEKARIVFRRFLRHPIQDVWSAVTDPKQVEVWFMVKLTREDAPGGRLEMEHPNAVHATGRVLEWRPPRVYEYEWNLPRGPNQPEGEASIVRWELSPSEGGTLLTLTHRKLSRPTAEIFVRGLMAFLDRLSAQMDGTALPDPPWISQVRPAAAAKLRP
jgi:uncharacterized protein YndB with AHSA1/START domain